MQDIQTKIEEIIANRRTLLPQVDEAVSRLKAQIDGLQGLAKQISKLAAKEKDDGLKGEINGAMAGLAELIRVQQLRSDALGILKTRFTRDTVNIGVSGEARVGKSTTLQKFAGLTDTQIPTGAGLPVTAVKSKIYNSQREYAEITFRDQASFIKEYIDPHLAIVNNQLFTVEQAAANGKAAFMPISISSLLELRAVSLPDTLGDNVDSVVSDSLKKLKEAQRGLATYEHYLTGKTQSFELSEIRKFVAYPTNEAINAEESGAPAAERAYIAVQEIKVFCSFPYQGGAKIGLVDLPGLGEIGDSVASLHLQGLEDEVDQIFLIMRPTESEGFVKQGIAKNLDQLRSIQLGVKQRKDLITAGINKYEGLEETITTLKDDFERSINSAQQSDRIELIEYQAVDDASVAGLFERLLQKISENLPKMDQEVFNAVLGEGQEDAATQSTLEDVQQVINKILKKIPLPDKILHAQIDKISRAIIAAYNDYEVELLEASNKESEVFKAFKNDVEKIFKQTQAQIADGFFMGSATWDSRAKGRVDYYNFYRDEAKRVRREIIARYDCLDEFYRAHVDDFKTRAIEILLENTGNLRQAFAFGKNEDPDSRIAKMSDELGGTVKDEDLLAALDLLKRTNFSFRNNVFLQISAHLEDLANPEDDKCGSKQNALGSVGKVEAKIESLKAYLTDDANLANNRIQEALLKSDDKFNEYLKISISFYLDYLYRKDVENFKHIVVRSLVKEYGDYILTARSDQTLDRDKSKLIAEIKESIKRMQVELTVPTAQVVRAGRAVQAKNEQPRNTQTKRKQQRTLDELEVGQRIEGEVKSLVDFGAFVGIGCKVDGLIHISELSEKHIEHPSEIVSIGDKVMVKIIGIDSKKEQVSLSLK